MKRRLVLLLLLAAAPVAAQTDETVRAALFLTGADGPEELDDRFVEELESWRNRPLPLNRASRARLLESGLLTSYQVATLEEYRSVSGDVLSFAELELVDGFGKEAVAVLRPFLSLESARSPGVVVQDTLIFRHSAILRVTLKDVGAKYRLQAGRMEAAGAWKGQSATFYGLFRLRKGKILIGDFNARYGQGLAFWSAFQLAGLSTLEAFSKRANGIAPAWSFNRTGTYRGLAWDYTGKHGQFALFGALDGTVGAHAGWLGRSGQAGVTATPKRVSLDGRFGFRGVDLFGEAAWGGNAFAGLAGTLFPLGEHWKGALQLRAIPSAYSGKKNGEYGAAAGLSYLSDSRTFKASVTIDGALLPKPESDTGRRQVKSTGLLAWTLSENWLLESRLVVRLRNYDSNRTDLRTDATWNRGTWTVKGRLNGVHDGGFGILGYLEGGWKPSRGAVWLRFTGFGTPSWQARIYCYERDAPGNFTSPAYYGTGFSAMAYAGWKKRLGKTDFKLYLRGSYKWQKEKPGQAGLKFQLMADR
ncbi:MAG: hypothetical protein IKM89_03905 [Bacteroidales bacterium]|nr:hypothetical protein [Bacteroidales bacterium]